MVIQLTGLLLIMLGVLHIWDPAAHFDYRTATSIQGMFMKHPWLGFFREIWHLGRTPLSLISLGLLTAAHWQTGLSALAVFLVSVGIERAVKITFDRPRPYQKSRSIRMLQPAEPSDPSFPSGDCLRVWYLALILPAGSGFPGVFLTAAVCLAFLVSLGRIVLGVHYLTDITAGTGLGLLAAGTTFWVWQMMNLL